VLSVIKFMLFAVVAVIASVMVAPFFTDGGSDTEEVAKFTMERPETVERSSAGSVTLDQLHSLATMKASELDSLDMDLVRDIAGENPGELMNALQGDATADDQTKRIVEFAVGRARDMIETDGFFVKPGTTKPQE
jgi:hypothetical protein